MPIDEDKATRKEIKKISKPKNNIKTSDNSSVNEPQDPLIIENKLILENKKLIRRIDIKYTPKL